MIMLYYKDLINIIDTICKLTNEGCRDIGFGYYEIPNCSQEMLDSLPPITLQLGSYPYDLQSSRYLSLDDDGTCTFNLYGSQDP